MCRIMFTLFMMAALFVPMGSGSVVSAAPQAQAELFTITLWAFIDHDKNGYYSAGDFGLSDVTVCLQHNDWYNCGGTDLGDHWWDSQTELGRYYATLQPETVPTGLRLRSIRCQESGSTQKYPGCHYNKKNWLAIMDINQPNSINVFFAFVPTSKR